MLGGIRCVSRVGAGQRSDMEIGSRASRQTQKTAESALVSSV